MKIEAKALLLDHAAEVLDAPFTPGPAVPRPPPQSWDERGRTAVIRSIGGDDDVIDPRLPGVNAFVAAALASKDWGTPIRSSSDPDRFKRGGGIGSGGGVRVDSMAGRERYALFERELERCADKLEPRRVHSGHTFDGVSQVELWIERRGGALVRRAIRGEPPKRTRRGVMSEPRKLAIVTVPERHPQDVEAIVSRLAVGGIVATEHEVVLLLGAVTRVVVPALVARGWCRPEAKAARAAEDDEMTMTPPTGYDLCGWKDIAPIVGRDPKRCRDLWKRAAHPLPVEEYLGSVIAKRVEIEAWVAAEVERGRALRVTAWSDAKAAAE